VTHPLKIAELARSLPQLSYLLCLWHCCMLETACFQVVCLSFCLCIHVCIAVLVWWT